MVDYLEIGSVWPLLESCSQGKTRDRSRTPPIESIANTYRSNSISPDIDLSGGVCPF